MKLAKEIIKELKNDGSEAFIARDTARQLTCKIPYGPLIYITTSASLSKIRETCKKLGLSCRIYNKINRMTLELIVNNRYIIYPYICTIIKNNYASRKYSTNKKDSIMSQGFTINSLLHNGPTLLPESSKHINEKLIALIGDPYEKITENRMYMLEAGKLLAELGNMWSVDMDTYKAITTRSLEITIVSADAIRKAMTDIIKNTDKPSLAFRFFKNTGILNEILPEMIRGVGLPQSNKSSNLDLFNHIMYALDSVNKNKPNYEILRWACVFHDIAKPYTKSFDKKGNIHFYGHDKIGAIFATRWLEKYKFEKHIIYQVANLCRHHLFDASLRLDKAAMQRLIQRVGKNHIFDLLNLREADRWGTGRKDISMKKLNILRNKIKKILE